MHKATPTPDDAGWLRSAAPLPYYHQGRTGGTGVLMLHGLTASPTEVLPLASGFARHAPEVSVACPLLPGHGTTPAELRQTGPEAWHHKVHEELDRLADGCSAVAVLGVSMGALLGLEAAVKDDRVRCLVMLAPVFGFRSRIMGLLPLLRFVMPYSRKSAASIANHRAKGLWSYDRYPLVSLLQLRRMAQESLALLEKLRVPTLVAHGNVDRYVPRESVRTALQRVAGGTRMEFVECPTSGHVLPHEPDAPMLIDRVERFIGACCGGMGAGAAGTAQS